MAHAYVHLRLVQLSQMYGHVCVYMYVYKYMHMYKYTYICAGMHAYALYACGGQRFTSGV